jgi:uncharacterized protein
MEDNNQSQEKISFVDKHGINPVLFGAISIFVIFITYQIIGSLVVFLSFGADFKSMSPNMIRIVSSFGQIIFLLLPTLFLTKLMPDKFKEIFKLNKISIPLIFFIIISVFAIMEIAQVLLILQSQIPLPESLQTAVNEFKQEIEETYRTLVYADNFGELSFVVLVIAIIPALCEELLFRGLIQYNFIKGLGAKSGIIFTGILFAMFHFNPFSLIALAVLGIYFSFLTYRTNSIYSSMIGHFTNNFMASISLFFFGKDDVVLNTSDTIITSAQLPSLFLIFIVSLSIFIASLYMIFRETSNENFK